MIFKGNVARNCVKEMEFYFQSNSVMNSLKCPKSKSLSHCLTELFPIYQNNIWTIRQWDNHTIIPSYYTEDCRILHVHFQNTPSGFYIHICLTSESHSGYPLIYIWRKMAIDENRCQKCFRGHLDRLQTWDTRMPPTFILPCGFLLHLTNSVSGSFFGSKVFLFPIIITTITYLPVLQ